MHHLEDVLPEQTEKINQGLEKVVVLGSNAKFREMRKAEINAAIVNGCSSIKEVASKLNLAPFYVGALIKEMGIYFIGDKYQKLYKIKQAISQGYNTIISISHHTGVIYSTVAYYKKKYELLPKKRDLDIEKIKKALKKGLTLQQAAQELKITPENLRRRVKVCNLLEFQSEQISPTRENIRLLRHKEPEKDKLFCRLVRRGLTMKKIGEHFGFTRERARQRINDFGVHEYWKKSRKFYRINNEKEELKENRRMMLKVINQHIQLQIQSCTDDNWPEKMTAMYILKHGCSKGNVIPSEKIFTLYSAYHEARKAGINLTFKLLGKSGGVSAISAQRVLKSAGCKSLNWTSKCHSRLTPEQKKAIYEARKLAMSNKDLAYFAGRSAYIFHHVVGKREEDFRLHRDYPFKGMYHLTYSLASQIYEAKDLGFKQNEILDLFNVKLQKVRYALENRRAISAQIINALNIFHPEKKIEMPYLLKET